MRTRKERFQRSHGVYPVVAAQLSRLGIVSTKTFFVFFFFSLRLLPRFLTHATLRSRGVILLRNIMCICIVRYYE